ncbi:LytTR family transcriptional regulator DNA-binding domain-containing protein [Paenibacillus sp. SC116]|uniref:LytTR family transcriptional regulator DNA-binding domain-containing protein n=1 Tax=Paenibacillus sp. SC116 TaxID=2968986 RepID=UPI00215AF5E8|nr:LytTR family transcriptional regulator DNA-binding domain-containing protein [Paenibacillus sp. SC116]MCR8845917.1 LytTR family transcriptional regulator DNA-binding domain-containing protein [Paenibacillus sp. SC116]
MQEFTTVVAISNEETREKVMACVTSLGSASIHIARSKNKLIQLCMDLEPDLVLTSTQLKEESMIMACHEINLRGVDPPILFLQEEDAHRPLPQHFETDKIAVLKQLSTELIEQRIRQLLPAKIRTNQLKPHLIVCKLKDHSFSIREDTILFVEKISRLYSDIVLTDSSRIRTLSTLKEIYTQAKDLFQSHRSYLVNKLHIQKILPDMFIPGNYSILLHESTFQPPLSRRYYERFLLLNRPEK